MNAPVEPQITELTEINTMLPALKGLPGAVKTLQTDLTTVQDRLTDLRRISLSRAGAVPRPTSSGQVSDDCAAWLGATFVAHCEKSGRIEALCSATVQRDALVESARRTLDLSTRAALTTTDVPLPIQYAGEIRELISQFGVVRSHMTRYPIGMGVSKPARMGIREAEAQGSAKALFDKVDSWYWTAVFTARYSHAVDTQAYADSRAVAATLKDDSVKPHLTADVVSVISEMKKASRTSALAKAFYNLLILNGSLDFLTGQPARLEDCEVDHMFPTARYPGASRNIFDLSVIHKDTNRKKSGKLPSDFLKMCLDSHGGNRASLLATLASHFISDEGFKAMENNNIDAFLAAREATFQKVLQGKLPNADHRR